MRHLIHSTDHRLTLWDFLVCLFCFDLFLRLSAEWRICSGQDRGSGLHMLLKFLIFWLVAERLGAGSCLAQSAASISPSQVQGLRGGWKREGFSHTFLYLMAKMVKNQPSLQERRVWLPDREDPLEKAVATQCCLGIPWTDKPDGLQLMRLQRVG